MNPEEKEKILNILINEKTIREMKAHEFYLWVLSKLSGQNSYNPVVQELTNTSNKYSVLDPFREIDEEEKIEIVEKIKQLNIQI